MNWDRARWESNYASATDYLQRVEEAEERWAERELDREDGREVAAGRRQLALEKQRMAHPDIRIEILKRADTATERERMHRDMLALDEGLKAAAEAAHTSPSKLCKQRLLLYRDGLTVEEILDRERTARLEAQPDRTGSSSASSGKGGAPQGDRLIRSRGATRPRPQPNKSSREAVGP